MEAFSIIQIPWYIKKKLKPKLIGSNIDYKRFNIKDRKIFDNLHLKAHANDLDNADILYEWEIALKRVYSPRWIAHNVLLSIVWWKPIWFAYIEIYWLWQWLKGSVWRIDFKGSFFHFYEQIPQRWKDIYAFLSKEKEWKSWSVRETRKDIAFDFLFPFPQSGDKWIVPSWNSKRNVECYKHQGKYNSFWYLAEKNTNYGVRIYNKLVDIRKNGKEFWYWWEEKLPKNWVRIEFEFYPPYSQKSDEELMAICAKRILWDAKIVLWLPYRPCFDFKVENAYSYFKRYAENHWITVEVLLDELMNYHIELEYKKELASEKICNNS